MKPLNFWMGFRDKLHISADTLMIYKLQTSTFSVSVIVQQEIQCITEMKRFKMVENLRPPLGLYTSQKSSGL